MGEPSNFVRHMLNVSGGTAPLMHRIEIRYIDEYAWTVAECSELPDVAWAPASATSCVSVNRVCSAATRDN